MRLNDILTEEELDEINWKKGLATAAAAGAMALGSPTPANAAPFQHQTNIDQLEKVPTGKSSTVKSNDGTAEIYVQWGAGAWFDIRDGFLERESRGDPGKWMQEFRIKLGNAPTITGYGLISKDGKSLQLEMPGSNKEFHKLIMKHEGELKIEVSLRNQGKKIYTFKIEQDNTSKQYK